MVAHQLQINVFLYTFSHHIRHAHCLVKTIARSWTYPKQPLLCSCSEKQHVPLEEYVQNLRAIVQHVSNVGCKATVLITPPPVFEEARLIDRQQKFGALAAIDPERTNAMTGFTSLASHTCVRFCQQLLEADHHQQIRNGTIIVISTCVVCSTVRCILSPAWCRAGNSSARFVDISSEG